MFRFAHNINRSGMISQGGGSVPLEPTVQEIQQAGAATTPFEAYLVAIVSGQIRMISYDQLPMVEPGSAYMLLCSPIESTSPAQKEVYFISQILGFSAEFEEPSAGRVRTVWVRIIRRPGQLGQFKLCDEVYMFNVKVSKPLTSDEILFVPAVSTVYYDPLGQNKMYSTATLGMDGIMYGVSDTQDFSQGQIYQVDFNRASTLLTDELSIDLSTPVVDGLVYSSVPFFPRTDGASVEASVVLNALDLVAIATLQDPQKPESRGDFVEWSCLHKDPDTTVINCSFMSSHPSKIIANSLVADPAKSETITIFIGASWHLFTP